MNWRWPFTGFIIALAILGLGLGNASLPNQEIVVQFQAGSVSEAQAKTAVAQITDQLSLLGISNFQISELWNGRVKVSYYSDVDIAVVKGLFSKDKKLCLGETGSQREKDPLKAPPQVPDYVYHVQVVKIHTDLGQNLGLQGVPISLKSAKDQYLKPLLSFCRTENDSGLPIEAETRAGKSYGAFAVYFDTSSYKIPEVRAGPLA